MAQKLSEKKEPFRMNLKNEQCYVPYNIGKVQLLYEKWKASRYVKAKLILWWAAPNDLKKVVFSKEIMFNVECPPIFRNDCKLLLKGSSKSSMAITDKKSYFPASVMDWAADPLIVDKGVKIDRNYHREETIKTLVPLAQQKFNGSYWTFQKDWAVAHSTKRTIALCQSLIPEIFS
uniref:Uncharacterized protein n=1 Tax=Caenorhabditis japonica TaxID=281687 RepID=A0A8R1ICA6_CAEJA